MDGIVACPPASIGLVFVVRLIHILFVFPHYFDAIVSVCCRRVGRAIGNGLKVVRILCCSSVA